MTDVCVTVPRDVWADWLDEGDVPGDAWSGMESHFNLGGPRPDIAPGERVYVVAHGLLRGYAPLVRVESGRTWGGPREEGGFALVRRGGAVAVTIGEPVRGFRGWRYRWWDRREEIAFPDWRNPAAVLPAVNARPSSRQEAPCAYDWHRPTDWERPKEVGGGYCCGLCHPDPRVLRQTWLAQRRDANAANATLPPCSDRAAPLPVVEPDGLPAVGDDRGTAAWLAGLGTAD